MLKLDPAKKLEEYRKKNKPPIFRFMLESFFAKLFYLIIICGLVYLCKDFIIVWYETLLHTIG